MCGALDVAKGTLIVGFAWLSLSALPGLARPDKPAQSSNHRQVVRSAPRGTRAVYDSRGNFVRFAKVGSQTSSTFHNGPNNQGLQLYKDNSTAPDVYWTDDNDPYYHHHHRHHPVRRHGSSQPQQHRAPAQHNAPHHSAAPRAAPHHAAPHHAAPHHASARKSASHGGGSHRRH